MNRRDSQNDPGAMLPPGEIRPIAEIEIGPTKHEKFLDQNYKKVALAVIAVALLVSGYIIYNVLGEEKMRDSGGALVSAIAGDGGMTPEKLDAVEQQYSGTHAATTAEYLKAISLWQQGKEDEGNAAMESFISKAPSDEWKSQALTVLGGHYMKAGKDDDARRYFENAIQLTATPYTPIALLSLGDIARSKNETEKAQGYYQEVIQKYPGSAFAQTSEMQAGAKSREMLLNVSAPERVRPSTPLPSGLQVPEANPSLLEGGAFELPGTSGN